MTNSYKHDNTFSTDENTTMPWTGSIDQNLALRWSEFVGCDARMRVEEDFLRSLLNKHESPEILDAAMGVGCEVIWFVLHGYKVIGNEISSILQKIAYENGRRHKVEFEMCAVDWRHLDDYFPENNFDLIFLTGNSFSLLKDEVDRIVAAKSLYRICKKRGVIVVDERNFSYIRDSREEILGGNFRYSGRVGYCGKSIEGRPIQIEEDCVTFGYYDTATKKQIGTLDMYPFQDGELERMFLNAGFVDSIRLSDLEKKFNPEADFFTYVLTK
ncbi:Glycine/sarcosine N-methyltransferase [Gimesia alba]|uniref:Glycine/sarcosine N-methyltransferase n=1 Tax=Gimesia alba TaxID=2527973 RepID=A0A517RHY0_9PLAN|nr:methyltransferase domain-containing protein [Gimesia alba]QDT43478.1 Glycine/sarcosine N-methyltransferase [Gimesia alba]